MRMPWAPSKPDQTPVAGSAFPHVRTTATARPMTRLVCANVSRLSAIIQRLRSAQSDEIPRKFVAW
jgi:hypothetical protein